MTTIAGILYRPTENHVAVIYRWGRFKRYASPDSWNILIPWIERVLKEVRMDMRTAHILLKDVLSKDRVPFDLELKVFFFVDLRETAVERRTQTFRFPTKTAWEQIVNTGITDIVRNVVGISLSFDELMSKRGRKNLKTILSSSVSERTKSFGICINPQFGVNIVDVRPNETFQNAMREGSAAATYGIAAMERLGPLWKSLAGKTPERALASLIMQMSSAIARNGKVPDIVFPDSGERLNGLMENHLQPSIQSKRRNFPTALS